MPTDSPEVALVRRLFTEVFQGHQLDVADEILMPDFTLAYPFPGFAPGVQGSKDFVSAFHGAFSELTIEIRDIFGTNGQVTVRWTARGKHTGELLGAAPSGEYVKVLAIGFYNTCPPWCNGGSTVIEQVVIGVAGVESA